MNHADRTFCIRGIDRAEDLADLLVNHTWPLCRGYEGFLNDTDGADDPSEYAAVKVERDHCGQVSGMQVDLIETSSGRGALLERIQELRKVRECMDLQVSLRTEPIWHHTCQLCS